MMHYRSMSFHEGWPDPRLLRLGSKLGFNDACFQTEKSLLPALRRLRRRLADSGTFDLVRQLKMTVSVWVHEFMEYDPTWGEPSRDNTRLWNAIRERYDWILTEGFPEADYLLLTVVETQVKATNPDVLVPLVTTIQDCCRRHSRRLILRSFVHHPGELQEVRSAIAQLPPDVTILTKAVPQDWHMRSIDDPLLGKVAPLEQFVEVDIAGEYFRMDLVANCFTETLAGQLARWVECGCTGLSVRVDRGWHPWLRQASVYGQAQEANLWALAYLASGRQGGLDAAWQDFSATTFGVKAFHEMIEILKPTGQVVAEGLYCLREPFGESKYQHPHPLCRLPKDETALAYFLEEDRLRRNPFHMAWSVFRWDSGLRADYEKIRKGHPDVIEAKTRAYESARRSGRNSLERLNAIQGALDRHTWRFFRFKLEENLFHLELMCEMQLAWLKLSAVLYGWNGVNATALTREAVRHLEHAERMKERCDEETIAAEWRGTAHRLRRGQYIDLDAFAAEFRRYWRGYLPLSRDSSG